jgi:hypothetical protein
MFKALLKDTQTELKVINDIDWSAMKKAEDMMSVSIETIEGFKQGIID